MIVCGAHRAGISFCEINLGLVAAICAETPSALYFDEFDEFLAHLAR
jgi:hypothetical protein